MFCWRTAFEALLRGHPVAEQRCPSCQITLPYEVTYAAQGTIDRSPRPSALHVAQRSNIKVSTRHWAIYWPEVAGTVEGTLGVFLPIKGPGVGN